MTGLDIDGVKQILQRSYPEVAHATVRDYFWTNHGGHASIALLNNGKIFVLKCLCIIGIYNDYKK